MKKFIFSTAIIIILNGIACAGGKDSILYTERQCRMMLGNVKSITSTDNLYMEFDEEGNLINYGGMSFYIDPVVWFPDEYTRFERRKEASSSNSNTRQWKFDKKGRLISEFEEGDDFCVKIEYIYLTGDDFLPSRVQEVMTDSHGRATKITEYEYTKHDKTGNWTRRNVNINYTYEKTKPVTNAQEPEKENWTKSYIEKAKYVYH